MKILILNGNPKAEYEEFDLYLKDLQSLFESKNHKTKLIMLRNLQLHDCIGCYACWLKTPGICFFDDGIDEILKEYLAADIVISASPVIMNFISALLKRVNDRMLPVMHPFLKLNEDRMGHFLRYSHYPKTVLLLDRPEGSNLIDMVYKNSQRGAPKILNTKQSMEEICNEVINY
ncbi:MAG: flavodoxin family protein [Clostridia bacterium]|nr:flavodoxin family protein [Clostridia bacterium]